MKALLVFLLITMGTVISVFQFSSDKNGDNKQDVSMDILNSDGFDQNIELDKFHLQEKPLLNKIKTDIDAVSKEGVLTDPVLSTSSKTIKEDLQKRMYKKQQIVKDNILKLDSDLQNHELKLKLKKQLVDSSDYKKDMLIKAKQEMKLH